ncbi:MAG: YfhO family protein [Roseburia sp.]|nr:YfhO family protein [Roseburia sp.]
MPRGKYHLTFMHKFLIGVLLTLGLFMSFHKEVFRFYLGEGFEHATVSYLPAGDYVLYVSYQASPEENGVCIEAEGVGEEELFFREIAPGDGEAFISFSLKQGVHGMRITTRQDEGDCLTVLDLQGAGLMNKDNYFLFGLCLLLAAAVFLCGRYVSFKQQAVWGGLFGLGLLASLPLFSDSIMAAGGQDLQFHLVRIEGIYQGLCAGEFPVRINAIQNGGYGNLSATMYPQLFLYFAAFLRLFGVSLLLSYKTLLTAINIATAFICYYSVKGMTDSLKIGMTASALYTFAAYRLSNVYFRAALGESLAMIFLPLVIWGIYETLWGKQKRWPLLMLGMTGVLQSHVLTVEMCVLFLLLEGIFWLIRGPHREMGGRLCSILKAAAGTFALNASMLVPFLYFCSQDLQAFHMPYRPVESVAYVSQLFAFFSMPEGYNLEPGSTQGEMPLSVGGVLLLGAILFVVFLVIHKEDGEGKRILGIGKHCLCLGLLALLLSSWIFPWEQLSGVRVFTAVTSALQFAWRFLSPASVLLCIVAAVGIVGMAEKGESRWFYGGFAALTLLSSGWFFDMIAHEMPQISDKLFLESLDTSDSIYMYSESTEFQDLHSRYQRSQARMMTKYSNPVEYTEYERRGSGLRVKVKPLTEEEDELMFPVYYYPGYEVRVNGEKVECYRLVGQVTCRLPREEALVELRYVGLPIFGVADIVSLLAALGFAGYGFKRKFFRKRWRPAENG